MKATIDADECTGCELCVTTCSEVFDMEDDVAVVKGDSVPGIDNQSGFCNLDHTA